MIRVYTGQWRGLGEAKQHNYMNMEFKFREYLRYFKGAALGVFMALCLHSDENGDSFPSYTKLEEETGYGRDTIANALNYLCGLTIDDHRVLVRYRVRDDRGRYVGSNKYKIFPTEQEVAEVEQGSGILPTLEKATSGKCSLEVEPILLKKNQRELGSTSDTQAQPVVVSRSPQRALASSSISNNKGKTNKRQQLIDYAATKGVSAETVQAMIAGVVKMGGDTEIAERFTDAGRRAVEEAMEVVDNLITLGHRDTSRFDSLLNIWRKTHWTAQPGANGGQRKTPRYRHITEIANELANGTLSWETEVFTPKTLKHNGKLVYAINEEGHYRDPDAPSYIYNKEGRFVRIDHDYAPESNTP